MVVIKLAWIKIYYSTIISHSNKFELDNIGRMRISFGVKQKKHIFVAHRDFLDSFLSLYPRIELKLAIFCTMY